MKALQHLEKALRRHDARLILRDGEIVLNIPERADLVGTLEGYAVDYRLGQQFPRPEPSQAPWPADDAPKR